MKVKTQTTDNTGLVPSYSLQDIDTTDEDLDEYLSAKLGLEGRLGDLTVIRCRLETKLNKCKKSIADVAETLTNLVDDWENAEPEDPQGEEKEDALIAAGVELNSPEPESPKIAKYASWEIQPTAVLFDPPIKGMGKKKIEAFIEAIATLGALEKLRIEAANGRFPLWNLLPGGIGKNAASLVEERLLNIQSSCQPTEVTEVTEVTEEVKPGREEAQEGSEIEADPAATDEFDPDLSDDEIDFELSVDEI